MSSLKIRLKGYKEHARNPFVITTLLMGTIVLSSSGCSWVQAGDLASPAYWAECFPNSQGAGRPFLWGAALAGIGMAGAVFAARRWMASRSRLLALELDREDRALLRTAHQALKLFVNKHRWP